jgi:glycosyltransferase involved in cell wall biosynthesis
MSDRVGFLGAVPDAMAYLPQVDILALPSRHEGMPMILLEAAACQVPVVAFDVGGVSEVLDGGGLAARLIRPRDVSGFRQALEQVLDRRDRIEADLQRWSAATHRRYSLEATTAAYLRLYRGGATRPQAA